MTLKTERIKRTLASTQGAGSSTFHVYRAERDKEVKRVENIERQHKESEERAAFRRRMERNQAEAETKTAKRRARRLARKRARNGRSKNVAKRQKVSSGTTSNIAGETCNAAAKSAGRLAHEREMRRNEEKREAAQCAEAKAALEDLRREQKTAGEPATNRNVFASDGTFMEKFKQAR